MLLGLGMELCICDGSGVIKSGKKSITKVFLILRMIVEGKGTGKWPRLKGERNQIRSLYSLAVFLSHFV